MSARRALTPEKTPRSRVSIKRPTCGPVMVAPGRPKGTGIVGLAGDRWHRRQRRPGRLALAGQAGRDPGDVVSPDSVPHLRRMAEGKGSNASVGAQPGA